MMMMLVKMTYYILMTFILAFFACLPFFIFISVVSLNAFIASNSAFIACMPFNTFNSFTSLISFIAYVPLIALSIFISAFLAAFIASG